MANEGSVVVDKEKTFSFHVQLRRKHCPKLQHEFEFGSFLGIRLVEEQSIFNRANGSFSLISQHGTATCELGKLADSP